MAIRDEFRVHRLNEEGLKNAERLAELFSDLLTNIEAIVDNPCTREMALVRTKLEEASFFAKRALAVEAIYQQD